MFLHCLLSMWVFSSLTICYCSVIQKLSITGVNLSELHTGMTVLHMSMLACLLGLTAFFKLVGLVTQLCSSSTVCVWSVDTCCVHTNSSLSVFTMVGTAVLSSLESGVVFLL